MSNIFYSNVDTNLQKELNARGKAGKPDRSNAALDYMLGKIANVQITAYSGSNSLPGSEKNPFAVLGGSTVRTGRFLPNGPNGFLSNSSYTTSSINYNEQGFAFTSEPGNPITDNSRRTGPFVSQVDITIGDHSMGLLNKASVNITIPNPMRDLEDVEDTWFRPGRYVKIEIEYPISAVITAASGSQSTGGFLSTGSLPNEKSLQERYGNSGFNLNALKDEFRLMNKFKFEGLITSFDFSYNDAAQVDATISLTGTSNIFTDISMFLSPTTKEKDPKKPKTDFEFTPTISTEQSKQEQANTQQPAKIEYFDVLDNILKTCISKVDPEQKNSGITRFEYIDFNNSTTTDQYILYGQPYDPAINDADINAFLEQEKVRQQSLQASATGSTAATASINLQNRISENNKPEVESVYHRYITLGALMQMTNHFISKKLENSTQFANILCDDLTTFSNYLPNLTSCIPNEILFVPKNPGNNGDMNWYGDLAFYNTPAISNSNWPGVYENAPTKQVIYTSRIFINVEFIQKLLVSISSNNTKNFTLKNFLAGISSRISYASGGAIDLKLRSDPDFPNIMYFSDTKYIKSSKTEVVVPVFPYSVPMLANHPNGTIVHSFEFKAKLPENAKNLSYVLSSGDEVTEDQIAPYMNFMYNSRDVKAINNAIEKYKKSHQTVLDTLHETRRKLSLSPKEPEFIAALNKALTAYLKIPTDDIKKSQQVTAPIFPFEVSFKIDGINGLRYGDVLTFEGLPQRYRINTVFSIISVTHNVSSGGQWTTDVRCIMRPSIE